MFARRQWLVERQTGLRIVGSLSSPHTRGLLEFAVRNRLPHVWLDTDSDPAADTVLDRHQTTRDQTPVAVMRGGEMLTRPSNEELARAAGIGTSPAPGVTYDVAIVGAGPAGARRGGVRRVRRAVHSPGGLRLLARSAPPPGSRTTWVSRSGSAATSSRSERSSRLSASGRPSYCRCPRSGCLLTAPAARRPTLSTSTAATLIHRAQRDHRYWGQLSHYRGERARPVRRLGVFYTPQAPRDDMPPRAPGWWA